MAKLIRLHSIVIVCLFLFFLPRCKWNMNALSVFPWNIHAPTNISWERTVSIGIPKLARFRSTPGRMFPSPCNYRFDTSTNREMYEVGNVFSGNIRTREISVSQIGMKPGRHITGNARRRECNEKCKDDWILVKTLTNQLICVQFPFVALLHVNPSAIALYHV